MQNLLWWGVTGSLEYAEQYAATANIEYYFVPNMLEGLDRARIVAEEDGRSDLAARLKTLQDALAASAD